MQCPKCHNETNVLDSRPTSSGLMRWRRRECRHCDLRFSTHEVITIALRRQNQALNDVAEERKRQDEKWGEQNHDSFTWMTVLTEEVGELAQAALHREFGGPAAEYLRHEAVQVAAVAVAMIECIDRQASKEAGSDD